MKVYVVSREACGVVLTRNSEAVAPDRARALARPAADEYAYGYVGVGPNLLALALLLDALRVAECALEAHKAFALEFFNVSSASREYMRFTQDELEAWFRKFAVEHGR